MTLFFYLFKDMMKSTLAVSLVLLLIVSSGRLAKYLSQASAGDLAPELVFSIIAFRLPDFLPLILPLGTFVGTMLVFGRLYIDSEMAALFASGVTKFKMLVYTCIPALLISMVVATLTLWAAPKSLSQVESLLQQSRNSHSLMLFREGKFINDRDGLFTAYIGKIGSDSSLQRIFFMQQESTGFSAAQDPREVSSVSTSILVAEDGAILPGTNEDERVVELSHGRIYENKGEQLDYRISDFETYVQRLEMTRGSEERSLKIDTLATVDLLESTDPRYIAALHWRFSLPATVIVVAILALAMSQTDARKGRYGRMLPAVLIYLIYIVSLSAVRNMIEQSRVPATAIWGFHLVYLLGALIAYYLPDMRRRLRSVPIHVAKAT